MSRGLTRVQAQKLILNGYINHITQQLSNAATQQEQQEIQEITESLKTQLA